MDYTQSKCSHCGSNFREDGTCPLCVPNVNEVNKKLAIQKERVMDELSTFEGIEVFAESVGDAAGEFFRAAGLTEDFCVQSGDLLDGVVVFGGTNRLQWSLRRGFRYSPSHCTEEFIERFRAIMGCDRTF